MRSATDHRSHIIGNGYTGQVSYTALIHAVYCGYCSAIQEYCTVIKLWRLAWLWRDVKWPSSYISTSAI